MAPPRARGAMVATCERCVWDRWAELDDATIVAAVERCGACPRLEDPAVGVVFERLRRAVVARDELERAHRSASVTLELMSVIASAGNAATEVRGMLGRCLPALCDAVGCAAGLVAVDGQCAAWYTRLASSVGPGEASAGLAASEWVRDLRGPPTLMADGAAAGFGGLLGIPVVVEDEIVASVVLIGVAAGPGVALAGFAQTSLAAQLGQVVVRQRALEASAQARESAERASRAKSDFVANISHELRTPLSAILGYGELLAEEFGEAGPSPSLAIITRMNGASRHLLGLINNVLDLSKIEAGKMEVLDEEFDVDELVDDVIATLTPMVEDRGSRLLRSGMRIGQPLLSDITKLRQILFNLIGNAAKFTRAGTIIVGVGLIAEDGRGLVLHLSVEDTGIGMNEAQVARLFEAFTQVEPSSRFGGTGLGLTLCRRFADLLGGSIHVTSKPGVGSRFSVEVPTTYAAAPARAAEGR